MSAYDTILTPWSTLADVSQLGLDPDATISAAAAVALEVVALWTALIVVATLLTAVPGSLGRSARSLARALTPVLGQRAVAAVIGIVGVAAPSTAWATTPTIPTAPTSLDLPAPGQPSGDVASRPAATTPAPVIAAPSVPVTPVAPAASGGHTVTVQRGDTLWGLARTSLPNGTSDTTVAAAWPLWWQLNRAVIGADPGLLLPGEALQVPGGAA